MVQEPSGTTRIASDMSEFSSLRVRQLGYSTEVHELVSPMSMLITPKISHFFSIFNHMNIVVKGGSNFTAGTVRLSVDRILFRLFLSKRIYILAS